MHDIMPPVAADAPVIQSYGPEGFRIGNRAYDTPVLLSPTAAHRWSGVLDIAMLAPVLDTWPPVELLLIGTGARHVMLDPTLREALKMRGIAVDSMNTGAACRTFNILLGEGRRVAAALQLPGFGDI